MRTLIVMTALLSSTALYAAPVPGGGVPLSLDADGEPIGSPWILNVEDDAILPDGLSIGGLTIGHLEVHASGIVVINGDGFDSAAPAPLNDVLMASVVAPFWANLDAGACEDAPAGVVRRLDGEAALTLTWRDVQLIGCEGEDPRATFSMTLGWNADGVVDRLEFRYEALPVETLVVEPRAGFRLQERGEVLGSLELLPDPDPGHLRGRAKWLLDGSSDIGAGLWTIELGSRGQVVGEREPQHLEADGETRRRPDGWREADNCPDHYNPLQEDFDADGRGDVCDDDADGDLADDDDDNCLWLANRDQADLDDDGVGDACDADDDGDGWPDVFDRCPVVAHPSNGDLDRDGRGDACDFDADADDPWAEIFRRFGFDRCPLIFDPLRMDRDWDGLGDACDLRPDNPCIDDCLEQADTDGDGVSDALDLCPLIHDPRQFDADGDGRGNVCDPDANGDGVVDLYQVCEWGLCAGGMNLPRLPGAWSF